MVLDLPQHWTARETEVDVVGGNILGPQILGCGLIPQVETVIGVSMS